MTDDERIDDLVTLLSEIAYERNKGYSGSSTRGTNRLLVYDDYGRFVGSLPSLNAFERLIGSRIDNKNSVLCILIHEEDYHPDIVKAEVIKRFLQEGRKPVICVETNKLYRSAREAEKHLEKGRLRTILPKDGGVVYSGGYHWRVATETEILREINRRARQRKVPTLMDIRRRHDMLKKKRSKKRK